MGPGIPGIGVASLFYVIAALIAPLRELPRTIKGDSTWRRWRIIGEQFGLAVLIIDSLIGLYATIEVAIGRGWMLDRRNRLPSRLPAWTFALIALAFVLTSLWLWSRWMRRNAAEFRPDIIAKAHRYGVPDQMGIVAILTEHTREASPSADLTLPDPAAGRAIWSIRNAEPNREPDHKRLTEGSARSPTWPNEPEHGRHIRRTATQPSAAHARLRKRSRPDPT